MRGKTIAFWLAVWVGGTGGGADLLPGGGVAMAHVPANPFVPMGAETQPPRGYVELCGARPALCAAFGARVQSGPMVSPAPSGPLDDVSANAVDFVPASPLPALRDGPAGLRFTCHGGGIGGAGPLCEPASFAGVALNGGGVDAPRDRLGFGRDLGLAGWGLAGWGPSGVFARDPAPKGAVTLLTSWRAFRLPPADPLPEPPSGLVAVSFSGGLLKGHPQEQELALRAPTLVQATGALPPNAALRVTDRAGGPAIPAAPLPGASVADAGNDWRRLLERVNGRVNARVHQQSDLASFGVPELWRPSGVGPGAVGDCEDLALEKRVELLAARFPPERLFLAVVWRRDAGLHTVLVARLDGGDVVLDSRVDYIEPWDRAGYNWVIVEAPGRPQEWRAVA